MATYRVRSEYVTVKTGAAAVLPGSRGGLGVVGVDRGHLLPPDVPVSEVAKLLRKGAVEPADGEVDDEVAAAVAVLDAEAEARRPPVPELSPAERLTNALARAGLSVSGLHEVILGALEQLVDERVRVALEEVRTGAASQS
jgi:hypothetical protein